MRHAPAEPQAFRPSVLPTHQPTNPPTHQPTNPPTHQPTNHGHAGAPAPTPPTHRVSPHTHTRHSASRQAPRPHSRQN
ncbi:PT domain-containing protein [Streptomyces sp. NPDC094147]|uniref:PT domain-containing protein n=1 Tax=Streptomyces sp. NPDC094147 TaxID=3366057 RepID=UPI0037FF5508